MDRLGVPGTLLLVLQIRLSVLELVLSVPASCPGAPCLSKWPIYTIMLGHCCQDWLHHVRGPVQDDNVDPFVY